MIQHWIKSLAPHLTDITVSGKNISHARFVTAVWHFDMVASVPYCVMWTIGEAKFGQVVRIIRNVVSYDTLQQTTRDVRKMK